MSQETSLTLGTVHNAVARLPNLQAYGLAIVCGVLTLFAFAPFHFWPILPFSFTLLIWLIDGAREQANWKKAVFVRGWLFGAGFTLASMHWMVSPFLVQPEQHLIFIWMPLILLPAGLGLFFGAASLSAGFFWSKNPGRIFTFVVFFSLFEFVRGTLFGGFPWNWFGTTWTPGGATSQLASVFGLYGLSILTVLLASAPAALADFRPNGSAMGRIFPAFLCVMIFGIGWSWGSARLTWKESDEILAARLVEIEVPIDEKYPPGNRDIRNRAAQDILRAYLEAMGDDFPDEPRLVIWPEGAIPFRISGNNRALPIIIDPDALDAISNRLGDRTLITGTVRVDRYANISEETWYNSLAILTGKSAQRGALGIYDKRRLVPFGEMAAADFIPLGHTISGILPPAMQRAATQGFKPGKRLTPSEYVLELPTGEKILPLICYEALFPDFVRKDAPGADILVNISIDSWFGGRIGPKQHFVQAAYRSIENGRPLIRVADQGVTTTVDPFGRNIDGSKTTTKINGWPVNVTDTTVKKTRFNTTYGSIGNLLSWLLLSSFITISLIVFKRTDFTG